MRISCIDPHRRQGFTLIEVVLVIAIIGIVSALTLPAMVGSIKGNRLKTASRSVVAAGKYARSLAVMRQQEMLLGLDLDRGEITVHSYSYSGPETAYQPVVIEDQEDVDSAFPEKSDSLAPAGGVTIHEAELVRNLDRVDIQVVEIDNKHFFDQGQCKIIYFPNGQCEPYSVRLVDSSGAVMIIRVDHLSGIEMEKSS
jgi:type II secretion system protein H